MEISQERQEALWKKCGWYIAESVRGTPYWYHPLLSQDKWSGRLPIPIDLNSLFKYAVPEDCTIQFQQHGDELDCVLYLNSEWYPGKAGKKEFAQALFLALENLI